MFSVMARCHRLSGNRHPADTIGRFEIQNGPMKAQDPFVSPFRSVLLATAHAVSISVPQLLREHTLVPLYREAMSQRAYLAWERYWQGHTPGPLPQPMSYRMLRHERDWRYCRGCIEADSQRYGLAYWHTVHQLPGLTTCTVHEEALLTRCDRCRGPLPTLNDFLLPSDMCTCGVRAQTEAPSSWDLWLHAKFERFRRERPGSVEKNVPKLLYSMGLPERLSPNHRALTQRVLGRIEKAVGAAALGELFEWYQGESNVFRQRSMPDLVWTTLKDGNTSKIRHPLYALVLMYAVEVHGVSLNSDRYEGDLK
ncbi:TniQ family protein [Ectothiorhodospiraceae bacterium WFHF3C12]|nr:TniQ family protein [Ectothiorhodospiraceae bacterium WFHF3C12]